MGGSTSRGAGDSTPSTLVYPPWKHTLGLHRVSQYHLSIYSGYRKKFSDPQGVDAVKLVFNDEEGAGDDVELTVYGVNAGTDEIFYNKSMFTLGFYGSDAPEAGRLRGPVGICADEFGNVFVADSGHNRVVHLVNRDNELGFESAFDCAGSGRPLHAPTGVALADGMLYICDSGNDRVVRADVGGRAHGELGRADEWVKPFDVEVVTGYRWNRYGESFAVVTDSLGQRLTRIDLDGVHRLVRRYREVSGEDGGFGFVAVDYYANVYVTDRQTGCIYKFDHNLDFITRFGCGSGTSRDLVEPRGITVYRRFGQVFVAEKAGASYFWVGTDVQSLACRVDRRGEAPVLQVRFLLTETSSVSVDLETADGDAVETLAGEEVMPEGYLERRYRLDPSRLPCPIADCTYRVVVRARATYSSRPYHETVRTARVR